MIQKKVNGSLYTLATESVDLLDYPTAYWHQVVGSTITSKRNASVGTPVYDTGILTATDTDFSSGKVGFDTTMAGYPPNTPGTAKGLWYYWIWLRAPESESTPAVAVVEVEVEGDGSDDNPYRPKLLRDIRGGRDYMSITWSAFEFRDRNHVVITIHGNNPYNPRAIDKQLENIKIKHRVMNYREAVEVYRKLVKDHPEWLAGKDNFAFQTLGQPVYEYLQATDFYYGELVEHRKHYQQLKQVPDWELRRNLNTLRDKLERTAVMRDEVNKHLEKLYKIEKIGW